MKQFKNILFAVLFAASAIVLSTTVFADRTTAKNFNFTYCVPDSTGDTTDQTGGGIINPGGGH